MKKIACFFIIAILILLYPVTARAAAPELAGESYILVEATSGEVLAANNENLKWYPASITKIMTMVLTLEAIESGKVSLDDSVITSEYAASMGGSQVYLYVGEERSLKEMLIAIAVGSGNDASVAVAEFLAGSESSFVEQMNQKAAELGMTGTHFANSHGLHDADHYTTAADMAKLGVYAVTVPGFLDYTSIYEYDFRPEPKPLKLWNTNRLLKWYDGTLGIKTGSTDIAKHNMVSCVKRGDLMLIGVVMGVPEARGHLTESMKLMNYGFNTFTYQKLFGTGDVVGAAPVSKGQKENVPMLAGADVGAISEKVGEVQLTYDLRLSGTLSAPVEKGAPVGSLILQKNGVDIREIPLLAGEDVAKKNWAQHWKTVLKTICSF